MMEREPPDARHVRCDPGTLLIGQAHGIAQLGATSLTMKGHHAPDGLVPI